MSKSTAITGQLRNDKLSTFYTAALRVLVDDSYEQVPITDQNDWMHS